MVFISLSYFLNAESNILEVSFRTIDDEDDVPALEILDEEGTPLSEGLDFDDLDEAQRGPENLEMDDYEELN
jgi:hypothetical protein